MLSRRELMKAFAAGSVTWAAGCGETGTISGGFVGPSVDAGHRIRDGRPITPDGVTWEDVDVVVVGGGVAGLSAARRLIQGGLDRILVLELEQQPGGTAVGGESTITSFPWGAHYVPVPLPDNKPLMALFDEMGVLEGFDDHGNGLVAEQFLCREPEERLFANGRWHEGLVPDELTSPQDRADFAAFQAEIDHWVGWRDGQGRRAFAIPMALSSDDPLCTALDRFSLEDWLRQQGLRSERLRWMLDYACRDDYACTIEQTSAWAGLFYFASRQSAPGKQPQPLVTWPEGNARIVHHLARSVGDRLRTGVAVTQIHAVDGQDHRLRVTGFHTADERVIAVRARRVILAVPQFVLPHVVRDFPQERVLAARQLEYAPWLVANVHLRDRPESLGIPLAWDSVFLDSASLGYITATHQTGNDYGPTVLTYYYPFCESDSRSARQRLLDMSWQVASDLVLNDLEQAHPDIRGLVERIDVMRWGHGMVRPRVGRIWSRARRQAAEPWGGIHFAHTDLSGMALFEEAFHHGNRAAEEVLAHINVDDSSSNAI